MTDPIEEIFLQELKQIKAQWLYTGEMSSDGYYDVEPQRIYGCIGELYRFYWQKLNDIADMSANRLIRKHSTRIFRFEHLNSAFRWQELRGYLQTHHGQDFANDGRLFKDTSLPFVFAESRFGEFDLIGDLATKHSFSCIRAEHCNLMSLRIHAGFGFDHLSRFVKFQVCDIPYLTFIGQEDQILPSPLDFTGCDIAVIRCDSNTDFGRISFRQCRLGRRSGSIDHARQYPHLTDAISFNGAYFTDTTRFDHCVFRVSPKCHETTFNSDTIIHKCSFTDTQSDSAAGDYRVLKQKMHGIGAENYVQRFHALELQSRRNVTLPKLWQVHEDEWPSTVASYFLEFVNNYGRNFWLPFLRLVLMTLIMGIVYWLAEGVKCEPSDATEWLQGYCASGAYSFSLEMIYGAQKSLGPLGFLLDQGTLQAKTLTIKVVALLHFVVSSIIWYLIIIQFRRPYRL